MIKFKKYKTKLDEVDIFNGYITKKLEGLYKNKWLSFKKLSKLSYKQIAKIKELRIPRDVEDTLIQTIPLTIHIVRDKRTIKIEITDICFDQENLNSCINKFFKKIGKYNIVNFKKLIKKLFKNYYSEHKCNNVEEAVELYNELILILDGIAGLLQNGLCNNLDYEEINYKIEDFEKTEDSENEIETKYCVERIHHFQLECCGSWFSVADLDHTNFDLDNMHCPKCRRKLCFIKMEKSTL